MDPAVQLTLSISVPTLAVLFGILVNNSRLSDMSNRFNDLNNRISDVNARIGELRVSMNQRFDDMQAMWRAELHRVEEVLDARLKHLEER